LEAWVEAISLSDEWINPFMLYNYFRTLFGRKPIQLHKPANMMWVMMLET
jgi:hypothetical protein